MDKDLIKSILSAEAMSFTREEINGLLDAELEKDPSEMDNELIEACLDFLEKGMSASDISTEKPGGTKKKFSVRKAALIAAVIAVLLAIAVPVSAKYVQNDLTDSVVQFYADHLRVDLRGSESKVVKTEYTYSLDNQDLNKLLDSLGIGNIILPKEMLSYKYSDDVYIQEVDYAGVLSVPFFDPDKKVTGNISFTHTKDSSIFQIDRFNVPNDCKRIETVSCDSFDVVVVAFEEGINIIYFVNDTEYDIALFTDNFDTALEIARSLN